MFNMNLLSVFRLNFAKNRYMKVMIYDFFQILFKIQHYLSFTIILSTPVLRLFFTYISVDSKNHILFIYYIRSIDIDKYIGIRCVTLCIHIVPDFFSFCNI